jgi:hypothetical protein
MGAVAITSVEHHCIPGLLLNAAEPTCRLQDEPQIQYIERVPATEFPMRDVHTDLVYKVSIPFNNGKKTWVLFCGYVH